MGRAQHLREVEVPERFDEWDENGQMNYLVGAMDRLQIANFLREMHGLDARDKPLFRKDELATIAVRSGMVAAAQDGGDALKRDQIGSEVRR